MKPTTIITMLLGLVYSSFALELSRLFWNQSPTTPDDAQVIEIVRWRQPICVVPDEGVLPCSHTLRKFQVEYERFNGKTLDERTAERSRVDLEPSIPAMDEESTIELIVPGIDAPAPASNSNGDSKGFSEGFSEGNMSEFHLEKKKKLGLDEEVRIKLTPPEVEAASNPGSPEVPEGFSEGNSSQFHLETSESADEEFRIKLTPPEVEAASNPGSPEVPEGFSEGNSSQFHLKTPELTRDQGKSIRTARRFSPGSSSSKLHKIYVTKVLESPMTATLVARNCLPDIGVPFCEDYQDYIQPATPYVDPKPTLTISAEIESDGRRQRHVYDSYPRRDAVQGFFVGTSPQKFVIIDFNSARSAVKLQSGDAEDADRPGVTSVYYTIKNPSQSEDSELATDLSKKTEGNTTGSSRVPSGSESNNSGIADGWSIGDEEESSRVPIRVPRYEGPDVPALSGLFEGLEDGERKESLRRPMGKEFPENDTPDMGDTRFGTVEEEVDEDYVEVPELTEPNFPALVSLFEGLEDNHREKSLMKPMRKLEDLKRPIVDSNRGNSLELPKDQVSNVSESSNLSKDLEGTHQESLKKSIAKLKNFESSSSNLTDDHSDTVKEESLTIPLEEMKKTLTMMEIPSRDITSNVTQAPDPVQEISLAEPEGNLEEPESKNSFVAKGSKVPVEERKKTSTVMKVSQNNTSNDGLTTPELPNTQLKLPDPEETNTVTNNLNRTVGEEPIEAPLEETKNASTILNSSSIQKIPEEESTVPQEPSTKPLRNSEGSKNSNSSFSQEKDEKLSQESHENATKTETSTTTPPSQNPLHKYGQRSNRTSTKTPTRTRVIGHRNYRPGHMFHRRKGASPRLKLKPSGGNSTRVGAVRRKYNKSRLAWVKPRQ
ncbi:uncharacterized protein LOC128872098 [Hylaeus volcanicus]|uniref:uncharacterized protein LOC128872098 n=1 Tax=Hylaeus volcanicus TaxID=313075 RepID=UPI0023B7BC51|nr:uncharacterized protein LOC128872098 [Hylaeus volcanicus]